MKAPGSSLRKHLGEIIALGVALATILAVCLTFALTPKAKADYADVLFKGELVHRLSLQEEKELKVNAVHGEVTISVKGNGVAVLSSPCSSHYCVNQGYKYNAGESIVCAPEAIAVYLRLAGEVTEVIL